MESFEEQAIRACQKGDLEKFGALYDKYIGKIYDFIYFRLHHQQQAEDLTSLVFLKAIEKISSYNFNKGAFSTWLYKIARNALIDHFRSTKKEQNLETVWDLSDDQDIEQDTDNQAQWKKVQTYLDKLEKEQREIILFRVWDGLSYQEIAEITGRTPAALKMAFSRAINKLRQDQAFALIILLLIIK